VGEAALYLLHHSKQVIFPFGQTPLASDRTEAKVAGTAIRTANRKIRIKPSQSSAPNCGDGQGRKASLMEKAE
jgi:hypothetical protein